MRATELLPPLLLALLPAIVRAEDRALLVGCTEYPNLRGNPNYASTIELWGPANDVALMRETLIRSMRFPAASITALAGWPGSPAARPTRANILGWLDRTAEAARRGDRVFILMAGHGTQQPDRTREEPDGLDELFLPADVRSWDGRKGTVENAISDDELGARLRAIRDAGAFVWVVMDCCHSGSMTRGADLRGRRLDPADLGVPPDAGTRARGGPREASAVPLGADLRGIVAFYAAPSYRLAPELRLPAGAPDAEWHGMLTFTLATQLARASGGLTFRELQSRVAACYLAQTLISVMPVAEGELDRTLAGDGGFGNPPLFLRAEGDRRLLNAGRLAGVRPGAILALRRVGEKAIVGHARVLSSGAAESVCESRDGRPLPDEELAAEIASMPLDDLRLGILLDDSVRNDASVAAALEESKGQVRTRDDAAWTLRRDRDGRYLLVRRDGLRLAVEADRLARRLQQIYKAETLTRLPAEGLLGGLPDGLRMELVKERGGGREPIPPAGELHPGDRTFVRIRNETGRHIDLTVLAVDSELGVTELFPILQSARIAPKDDAPLEIGPFEVNGETLGTESLLLIAVPREESQPEISFGWLAQPRVPTERSGEGGVPALLRDLAFGGTTRGEAPIFADAHACLITWRTTWGEVAPPEAFAARSRFAPSMENLSAALGDAARESWEPATAKVRERGATDLYRRAAPAVVVVRTRGAHGTGILVGPRGLILTNHHVVATGFTTGSDGRPRVQIHRGDLDGEGWMRVREAGVPARLLLEDAALDLALLEVEAPPDWSEGMEPLTLAPKGPAPGEFCALIGHPASGFLWTLRQGQVAQVGRMPQDLVETLVRALGVSGAEAEAVRRGVGGGPTFRIVLSTCAGNPGDSGSPLLGPDSQLWGITYAIPGDLRNDKFVYHVHRDEIEAFLARPRPEGPLVPDAWRLGPRLAWMDAGKGAETGFLVAGTARPEQILVDVDGEGAPDGASLEDLVRNRSFDAEAAFHFLRDRRIAFYDTDNDGSFDLVLVDEDSDPEADVRYSLGTEGWKVETALGVPWLSATYLTFEEGAAKAGEKFRLLRP